MAEAPICEIYYDFMTGKGYLLEQLYNYAIVVASYVFRSVFIFIAEKVRFLTLTDETRFVMLAVFHITFLNYGIIQICAGLDIRNTRFNFINRLFDGLYPDYNALWFNDIGNLIYAIMFSSMYWPVLEFFMYWGIRLLYRMLD